MQKTIGRNLILCPGFMNDHGLWAHMEKSLAAFGRCQFADQSQDSSFADIARRVLRTSPTQFILIGFSMGGYVAREVLRQAPQRVSGLVLINTSARPDTENVKDRNRELIKVTQSRGFRGLSPKALRNSLHPSRHQDEKLLDTLQSMALRMGEAAFINQLAIKRGDDRPTLEYIKCPTLVIWSRQDALRTLKEARELEDGIPKARLEIIEDSGHMTPLEQPEKLLQAVLNWFTDVDV